MSVTVLRGRMADRSEAHRRGAEALGARLSGSPRWVGAPSPAREGGWEEDLREARPVLRQAAVELDGALAGEGAEPPILLAGMCTLGLATLPVLHSRRPDARVLWLDAHGDLQTPRTSTSGFLGGMPLGGAIGGWDAGLGLAPVPPDQVVLSDARDLDPDERGVLPTTAPASVEAALDGAPVYVHLDPDVVDPGEMPALFPAPGGIGLDELAELLGAVGASCEVVGLEITAFDAPEDPAERRLLVEAMAGAVDALLPGRARG